jgi:hypothetical protein
MPSPEWLAEQFEQHRAHLRAVAYRMLGSARLARGARMSILARRINASTDRPDIRPHPI